MNKADILRISPSLEQLLCLHFVGIAQMKSKQSSCSDKGQTLKTSVLFKHPRYGNENLFTTLFCFRKMFHSLTQSTAVFNLHNVVNFYVTCFQEGKLSEEDFAMKLQSTLNSPPQPNLIGFLKVDGFSLYY